MALFTFNALVPETYAALLRFADGIWQASLSALSSRGESIPGAIKLVDIARQGFSGHHYVIMALCSVVASFLVNAAFAFATRSIALSLCRLASLSLAITVSSLEEPRRREQVVLLLHDRQPPR